MSMSVTVLTPKGYRQIVKVSPNTSIHQVLEEVCKKQGCDEAEYYLLHLNKKLDLSSNIRFSNISNNGKLELKRFETPCTKKESKINVCFALETGQRIVKEISNIDQTLWDATCDIQFEERNNDSFIPVCVYMRTEITGEENLKSTTFRKLGIREGSALIRFIHRKTDAPSSQPFVEDLYLPKPEAMDMDGSFPKIDHWQPVQKEFSQAKKTDPEDWDAEPTDFSNDFQNHKHQTNIVGEWSPVSSEPTISAINLISDTKGPDGSTLTMSSEPAINDINLISDTKRPDGSPLTMSSEPAISDINLISDTKGPDGSPLTMSSEPTISDDKSFSNTKVSDTTEEEKIIYLDDRQTVLFSQNDAHTPIQDLPDDFFELDQGDLLLLNKDLTRKREQEEERQLQTSAMRQAERLKKLKKYKRCIIRILFDDSLVLQGIFKPDSKVKEIEEFVREFLADKQLNFYFYVIPPKKVLPLEKCLYEESLVPTAIIRFGCNEVKEHYLDEEIMKKRSSFSGAKHSTSQIIDNIKELSNESAQPPIESKPIGVNRQPVKTEPSRPADENRRIEIRKSQGAIPKWFKAGKK